MSVQKVEGCDELRRVESSNVLGKFAEPRQVKEELAAGTVLQHNEQLLFGLARRRSKQELNDAGNRETFYVVYRRYLYYLRLHVPWFTYLESVEHGHDKGVAVADLQDAPLGLGALHLLGSPELALLEHLHCIPGAGCGTPLALHQHHFSERPFPQHLPVKKQVPARLIINSTFEQRHKSR